MSTALDRLGLSSNPRVRVGGAPAGEPGWVVSENPSTGKPIAAVRADTLEALEREVAEAVEAFRRWRAVPAPQRGQVVRAIAEEFRRHRDDLGELVSLEVGKIRAEGVGEIQEIIDIADLAVGLSRQLPGQVIPSERAGVRLMEQWLPLGPVGVITAFNFPAAVWGWNAMLAAVCGDSVIWKPSGLAPLTALACQEIAERVSAAMGHAGVFRLVIGSVGEESIGEALCADRRVPLISATGSCRMGRRVGQVVAGRLGRTLLELGGNNAAIVHADADLDLALKAILFSAVGTCGQRCTSTRRLIVHESIAERFIERLTGAYKQVIERIGDPLAEGTLVGPLIHAGAVEQYEKAIAAAKQQGGTVLVGGRRANAGGTRLAGGGGHFVEPTLIRAPSSGLAIAREETFAPITYVFTYRDLDEAVALHNGVDQGLASAIFTEGVRPMERFLAPDGSGSDCGLAYVNLGTSGAEIGGAFGGEKDTGGGRESGSDSWKAYMRRQTVGVNFGGKFELAQGIRFE
jgi:aldehyde dehydrogenase (NAD+)